MLCTRWPWFSLTAAAEPKATRTYAPAWRSAPERRFSATSTRCASSVTACKTVTACGRTSPRGGGSSCRQTRGSSRPCCRRAPPRATGWRATFSHSFGRGSDVRCSAISDVTSRRRRCIRRADSWRSGSQLAAVRPDRGWGCVHTRGAGGPSPGSTSFEGVLCVARWTIAHARAKRSIGSSGTRRSAPPWSGGWTKTAKTSETRIVTARSWLWRIVRQFFSSYQWR